jgi:hypothetical protein
MMHRFEVEKPSVSTFEYIGLLKPNPLSNRVKYETETGNVDDTI